MTPEKWIKYLRIPDEHPPSSENEQNMVHYGRHVLGYERVLDVGCGTGMLVNWLTSQKIKAVGCTVVKKEIAKGKNRYGDQIRIDYADMHDLPYSDGTLDAIHCKDVLEHAIAPYIALCEFNRVLKKGGFLLIVQPGEEWIECDYHYAWMYDRQMAEMFRKTKFKITKKIKAKPPRGSTTFTEFHCVKEGEIKW